MLLPLLTKPTNLIRFKKLPCEVKHFKDTFAHHLTGKPVVVLKTVNTPTGAINVMTSRMEKRTADKVLVYRI